MKDFIIVIALYTAFFFGAALHEMDLAKNFNRDGDAHAWFYTIKCEDGQK